MNIFKAEAETDAGVDCLAEERQVVNVERDDANCITIYLEPDEDGDQVYLVLSQEELNKIKELK